MSESEDSAPVKVEFRKKGRKQLRQRRLSNSDEDEAETNEESKLEETKEKQKLRNRRNGVNILSLAAGKKISIEEEVTVKDPFNIKTGGMVNMHALKAGKLKTAVEDPYDTGIGTQFSAETNKRDEDEEMMKYIEEELGKRKGIAQEQDNQGDAESSAKYLSPEEAALLSLPAHLSQTSSQRSEEMLSNQMLSGIPEIDLGIEAKIKNIEATEEAKLKYMQEQQRKKDLPSHFVPSNMAVNFMQHNRYRIDNPAPPKRRYQEDHRDQRSDDRVPKKATDDYHFDKFKKQYRRH
ncbi:splicing factor C9orf78 homolog isoform X2 [Anopheles ziemanni]|uniref:splicing factor C9orf78 homolog isoform X2 n=1 Tax=Anopheles coustani TaxID=139045 RepID=UPI00265A691A|nr:splicing factor C9orf78 homolog isoform X2 [Anopheles coustani]XP_058179008.1 splicing factor C9orf78 homolog isoform X2 [Anopheles ziemanni]